MSLAMVDCRSLIQFCRAFHPHHQNDTNSNQTTSSRSKTQRFTTKSLNPLCNHSPLAALDLIILLLVLTSLAFLILPYFNLFFCYLLPIAFDFIIQLVLDDPVPYSIGFVFVVIGVVTFVVIDSRLRRCGNPHCKGLRRAVEYDIQLETEKCVKYSTPDVYPDDNSEVDLGQDRKELEAELKKMAPPNGRTVLIFRAPCGCPAGRLEVWGPKKVRRIKK